MPRSRREDKAIDEGIESGQTQESWKELLRDHRDRLQYWTFWLIAIIGFISIILTLTQVLLAGLALKCFEYKEIRLMYHERRSISLKDPTFMGLLQPSSPSRMVELIVY